MAKPTAADIFVPHPLLQSGHAQTIFGSRCRPAPTTTSTFAQHVLLDDGDRLVIHVGSARNATPSTRAVLLFHGLGGSFRSPYMRRLFGKLVQSGYRAIGVEARGCGSGISLSRGHTHAGRTEDQLAAVAHVHRLYPDAPLTLVAFSLAGNTLLKLLGDSARDGQLSALRVDGAIAVAPPIDLQHCLISLQTGLSRIYDMYYTRTLLNQLRRRRRLSRRLHDRQLRGPIDSVVQFDEQFTAPIAGYRGAREYYAACSAQPVISQINIPTKILVAADDPIVDVQVFRAAAARHVHWKVTRHGGHLGYFSKRKVSGGDRWWMDWQILDWIRTWHR